MQTKVSQKFQYHLETMDGRIIAKFSLISEAITAADALAGAYSDKLCVVESRYSREIHRTFA